MQSKRKLRGKIYKPCLRQFGDINLRLSGTEIKPFLSSFDAFHGTYEENECSSLFTILTMYVVKNMKKLKSKKKWIIV